MDPLNITATVIGLTARCLGTAKTLYCLRDKFKNSQMTISAIYSECTVISASLGHVQSLVLTNPEILRSNLQSRPELEAVLDSALTGCVLVFSILDDEVQSLNRNVASVGTRVAHLWKEGTMSDLLAQIRGQQTALSLLIQALQTESILDVRTLLRENNTILQQLAQRTKDLRRSHPKIKAPSSILEASTIDIASILSVDDSVFTSTAFIFDDDVINSKAYRRALAASNGALPAGQKIGGHLDESNSAEKPESFGVMQRRYQDLEQLMRDKLDVAHRENMMAAEREKLYHEELKTSLEELEKTKKSMEDREKVFEILTNNFKTRDDKHSLVLAGVRATSERNLAAYKAGIEKLKAECESSTAELQECLRETHSALERCQQDLELSKKHFRDTKIKEGRQLEAKADKIRVELVEPALFQAKAIQSYSGPEEGQLMPPRNPLIDPAVSSLSSTAQSARWTPAHGYKSSQDSVVTPPTDIAGLIAAAGLTEAALQKLREEKQSADSHNAQLWRLIEKQRAMILGLNRDLEKSIKGKDRYRKKLKDLAGQRPAAAASATTDSTLDREYSQSPAPSEEVDDRKQTSEGQIINLTAEPNLSPSEI